jgi:plasmid replication initiation protein
MQNVKKEFNKDIEILKKKSNWNLGNKKLNNPNKNSVESFANGMKQIENMISRMKDKAEELDQSDKHRKNTKKIWMEHARPLV